MTASAPAKVATFASEVLFEKKPRTLTKPEVSPSNRIDLRVSGEPEEPCQLNEKQAEAFLIPSLVKQVLKSPIKSTMINDLIKNYSRKNAESRVVPAPCRDAENHALLNSFLERHEDLKIEDRVQSQICFLNIKDQARYVALVEAFYKAPPKKSRSRQSNGSTVDSSCTSLEFTI